MNRSFFLLAILLLLAVGCGKVPFETATTYDLDGLGVPKFMTSNFVNLDKIKSIVKLRSSHGHDYSDDFESNRSMKHYFIPKAAFADANDQIECYSPINGKIIDVFNERINGKQIRIRSLDYNYTGWIVILFHLNTNMTSGTNISAGQLLGYFDVRGGNELDIAVQCITFMGTHLFSCFDVMTDSVFNDYIARGVPNRETLIISKEYRDANPADFSGERELDTAEVVVLN